MMYSVTKERTIGEVSISTTVCFRTEEELKCHMVSEL